MKKIFIIIIITIIAIGLYNFIDYNFGQELSKLATDQVTDNDIYYSNQNSIINIKNILDLILIIIYIFFIKKVLK